MLKILVIDNNPVILKLMTNMLSQQEGHHVMTAWDGLSALECLKDYSPDIIFVDMIMPNISGEKLCRIIRSKPEHHNCTMVILSAFAVENALTPAKLGAEACIAKGAFDKTAVHIQRVIQCHIEGKLKELSHEILGLDDVVCRSATLDLLNAKKHFEVMLQNVSDGILELNNDSGKVIFANTAAQEILGLPEEKILFIDLPAIFKGSEGERINELFRKHKNSSQPFRDENPFQINNRLVSLNIIPVEDEKGNFTIVVLNDITDQKQSEKKLREYAETQNVLLREVNHRVKNNLTAILSMLHQEEDRADKEGKEEYIARLHEVMSRVQGLFAVHSLLTSSQWQPLSLTILCENVIKGSIHLLHESKSVQLDIPLSDLQVDSDQAHYLAMVLNELVTNSIKYGFQKRSELQIKVSASCQNDLIELRYQDDGAGYPEAVLQGDIPSKCIGYNLITGIVRKSLQGDIEFFNDNGATARVTLPRVVH